MFLGKLNYILSAFNLPSEEQLLAALGYGHITADAFIQVCCSVLQYVAVCCSMLQCVAVCCSVLQCVAMWCSVVQCGAVRCSVLQCIAVCCSVLHCTYSSLHVRAAVCVCT